jgi:hypothetical protein
MTTVYCGAGKIPKNKVRGTRVYCAKIGQVRYHGIEGMGHDAYYEILKEKKRPNLGVELRKLFRINLQAEKINKKLTTLQALIKSRNSTTKADRDRYRKKILKMMPAINKVIERGEKQQKIVDKLKKEKEEEELAKKNNKKKPNKKKQKGGLKRAGSKVSSKKSNKSSRKPAKKVKKAKKVTKKPVRKAGSKVASKRK